MRTPRNNDPAMIRKLIADMRESHDGDRRLMGDALHFYANGCHPEALVGVMDNASDAFIAILMDFREQLYVNVDTSELRDLIDKVPPPYKPGPDFEGPLRPGN